MAERNTTQQENLVITKLNSLGEKVDKIERSLTGSISEGAPGIMERIRRLEDWMTSEKRLMWLIIAIILSDVVMRLWTIIAPKV